MYEWNAEDYYRSSVEQKKWAQELIANLILKGYKRALDVGCGDGKVTAEVAKRLPNGSVLGIDNSEEMIHFARKKFPTRRYPNLTFEIMDVRNLNFKNEFDIIISNACLHWIIDHLAVLKGIKDGLKQYGKTILQMAGRKSGMKVTKIVERIIKAEKWNKYFTEFSSPYRFYGPEEYKKWLDLVGLKAKRVELKAEGMIFKGEEEFKAWIRTTWLPYTERIPEDLRQEFIDEIVRRYIDKYPPDRRGYIHIALKRLYVEAQNI